MKFDSIFSVMYETKVDIEQAKNTGSYTGDTKYEKICSIRADIQPYRTEGEKKDYGIFKNVSFVMFCADNGEIKIGRRAVIGEERFIIIGVQRRNFGIKAYLKEEGI